MDSDTANLVAFLAVPVGVTLFAGVVGCRKDPTQWEMIAQAFQSEFLGMIVMIAATFTPGKWWGATSDGTTWQRDWIFHWIGVVFADWSCGGPHVNPGVTCAMWSLGKIGGLQAAVHIGAQMAGGVVAFPLLQQLSAALGLTPLGGPSIPVDLNVTGDAIDPALQEFMAMFLLLLAIFVLNFEPSTRMTQHRAYYPIKQSITALVIRALIVYFPGAGPAINPALGTTWAVWSRGGWPRDLAHYVVYWVASVAGALAASGLYAMNKPAGRYTFFGYSLLITSSAKKGKRD